MKWNELSMKEKAAMLKVAVSNGITNLSEIKNKFEIGGPIEQQLREQYPHYTDRQIQLLVRSRQAQQNLNKEKTEHSTSNKDYSKDIGLVQQALQQQANSFKDIDIREAQEKQEQEAKDKWKDYKLGIEAATTGAELLAGMYFLSKAAVQGTNKIAGALSRTTNRYGMPVHNTSSTAGKIRAATDRMLTQMNKGQTAMSTIGTMADVAQLFQGDTSLINGLELTGDIAGIIGGTNIIRDTPWFGKYRREIDAALDLIGYGAAGYDVGHYLFGEE